MTFSADLYPATNLTTACMLPARPRDVASALVCDDRFNQSEQLQHIERTADRRTGAQMVKHPNDDRGYRPPREAVRQSPITV
jgi:hypothetical protein